MIRKKLMKIKKELNDQTKSRPIKYLIRSKYIISNKETKIA